MTRGFGMFVAVVLSTALFTAVESVFVGTDGLGDLYAPRAVPVLPASAPAIPGSAHFRPVVVAALEAAPFVEFAVAETFAYSALRGEPVVIRGANLSALLALHDARIVAEAARTPGAPTLFAGERAAARLGLVLGSRVILPGTLHSDIVDLRVDGIIDAETAIRDELLVDRATGVRLAGLEEGAANVIEVIPRDARALDAWLADSRANRELSMDLPRVARAGTRVEVVVRERDGSPVAGVELSVDNVVQGITDAHGARAINVPLGIHTWRARATGRDTVVHMMEGASDEPFVHVTRVRIVPELPFPGDTVRVEADVANYGGARAMRALPVALDGRAVATLDVALDPHATRTVAHTFIVDDAGLHDVTIGDAAIRIESVPPAELSAQWRAISGGGARAVTPGAAADAIFGSLALAAGLIGVLAFALFFLGNAALYARLVREYEAELALLRALGASPAQIRRWAMARLAPRASIAAILGLLIGVAAATGVADVSAITILGHGLVITFGFAEIAVLTGLALASTLGAAAVAVELWQRRAARPRDDFPVESSRLEEMIA